MGTPEREAAFRQLYGDSFTPLLAYALRRVDRPEDAADVVAETMLVAWRRLDDVPPGAEARLWLYGVARRVLANQHRSDQRRSRLGERLSEQLAVTSMADASDAVGDLDLIRRALASLSETDRELLQLTLWDGLAPRDAAVVLGVPAATIRTRLNRARTRLRDAIGDVPVTSGHVSVGERLLAPEEGR